MYFRKNFSVIIPIVFLVIYTLWFIFIVLPIDKPEYHYTLFTITYGLVALWGGCYGVEIAFRWGGFKSVLGKSILFFSSGLLLQELGQLAYSYYIYILKIELPYPSVGDFFFWGTIPLYLIGTFYLAKAAGVQLNLKAFESKLQAVFIPLAVVTFCYYIFLEDYIYDFTRPVKIIIDLGVPIGEALYLSLAILTYTLSKKVLGGMMKKQVLIVLLALFAQYVADWVFLYQASRGEWSVSGVNDYMYFLAYFLMAYALLRFNYLYKKVKHEAG